MDKGEISVVLEQVSELINQNQCETALAKFSEIETKYPNSTELKYAKISVLIDIGERTKNADLIHQGISLAEFEISNPGNRLLSPTYYNVANAYSLLFNLTERKQGSNTTHLSENLQEAKRYHRQALELSKKIPPDLRKQMWVNYGNCLDTLGRSIEALYTYEEALEIDSHFSMAIANKAKALCHFADISGKYREEIYIEAYQAIKSVINNADLVAVGGLLAKQGFEKTIGKIENKFKDKQLLESKLECVPYKSDNFSEFEKFYVNFCVTNRLFLNFYVHQEKSESAIVDPIFISLITSVKDNESFYRLAQKLNQIKEDYITARFLLVQSQQRREDLSRISRRTTLVYALDYSQFNLYVGLLKSAFRLAYNILDKIAVFLNDYKDLKVSGNIYFGTVFNNDAARRALLFTENISIYALYDIHKDFKNGHYKKLRDIRNALTHRTLIIFDMKPEKITKHGDEALSADEMLQATVQLFRLVKSATIYLINFVNSEEHKKQKNSKGISVPMFASTDQFL